MSRGQNKNNADRILSTSGIVKEAGSSDSTEFIIGTEREIVRNLKAKYPDKKFYPVSEKAFCYNMKKITLEAILNSLQNLEYEIHVPEHIRVKAKKPWTGCLRLAEIEAPELRPEFRFGSTASVSAELRLYSVLSFSLRCASLKRTNFWRRFRNKFLFFGSSPPRLVSYIEPKQHY